ncbi:MAG: asparagine synthase (glutamine-hydrolyzing) [Proteobacteria bacterium]|nr:asparagine synthase (glutamine-hydrolyzing) [Pseudomonadota bacterium]
MCGLAGIFDFDGRAINIDHLQSMTTAIAHRGPDGAGFWDGGHIGLGHRRLAIIDLSEGGHQPMSTPDGRYVISYNGEIYNFEDIRLQLQQKNVRFRSRSDTEVILQAIATWGLEKAVLKLNGMFAFAVYDRHARRLTLVRDRFGVKPLYYAQVGQTLLFGSEIKALVQHPQFRTRINLPGLVEYLTFQNFFGEETLFAGVKLLPAGCYAVAELADSPRQGELRVTRYWDYHFEEPSSPRSEASYREELSHLFHQAVRRQLVSDVDVGAFLSGGMDSGSITAVASRYLPMMRTFTCGFDMSSASGIELSFDERLTAERMSYLFKTEHYEMVLKAGDLERVMPRLAYHLEEPRVGQSYPNFYISQLASKFNKVVLAGTGGDELFGGYPWRYYRAVVNNDFDHYVDNYFEFWQRIFTQGQLKRACAPIWKDIKDISPRDIFKGVFKQHSDQLTSPADYVNHSLYFECKTFLHGLLVVEDKLSMAHSLETRVPFLDNDLVDFAMKLPVSMKLKRLDEIVRLNENKAGQDKIASYFNKTNDGKLLLRSMMTDLLPKDIVEREKQGFSAPDASWFKGESIDYVRERLLNPKARIFNLLSYPVVEELLASHMSGKSNRRLMIWSLLNLEELFDRYDLVS